MLRIKRSLITAFAVALLVPALALAAPTPPDQLARETVQSVLSKMEGRRDELRKNPQELYQLIDQELVPLIDLPYMSQLVLGRAWRTATPEQRDRFQTAFKNMLIRTYGNGLLSFDDSQEIEYQPVRAAEGADDVTFRAIVTTDDGQKTPVTFQLHVVDGEWKIYDGSVGNLSFVTNYRGQFNSQIRNGGLEQLIERMESRYNTAS
ncbi:ABC transporter substrate-binding protein [uncultured Salinisphaera sp.]|jgi:phospholipid transport system substrate-binding protein|uniref:MlaC/ttg2D family ABC transporter substrate-binding protein n=1 Tax=uncultured Salinisphaera sp. TaxID=359372 RepID=UPI0032B16672|tara:strand:+ start:1401 stop:2018 length:618 start_codon:yes stop_codon:yes gene_type:complete